MKLKSAVDSERSFEESQLLDYTSTFPFFQKQGWEVVDQPKSAVVILTKKFDERLNAVLTFAACGLKPKDTRVSQLAKDILDGRSPLQVQGKPGKDPRAEKIAKLLAKKTEAEPQFEQLVRLYIGFGGQSTLRVILKFSNQNISILAIGVLSTEIEECKRRIIGKDLGLSVNEVGFATIEPDVQKSVEEFLHSLGIDRTFSARVQQLSLAKDQKLYHDFLSKFSDLLEVRK